MTHADLLTALRGVRDQWMGMIELAGAEPPIKGDQIGHVARWTMAEVFVKNLDALLAQIEDQDAAGGSLSNTRIRQAASPSGDELMGSLPAAVSGLAQIKGPRYTAEQLAMSQERAWLLIEGTYGKGKGKGKEKTVGVALTNAEATAWVRGWLEPGEYRSALPVSVIHPALPPSSAETGET